MNVLIFLLTGLALTLLALAMPRHLHRALRHSRPGRSRVLRISGWMFLTASLGLSCIAWNGGASLVEWVALLAFHAFALSLLLAYRPRWASAWPAVCAALGALALSFAS